MKRSFRFLLVGLMLLTMSLGLVANAQDESILVIGWEQEPPLLNPRVDMTFAALLDNFFARDVWSWDVGSMIWKSVPAIGEQSNFETVRAVDREMPESAA